MTASAEVVVIGAGVVGASTAFNLASRGARGVRLLERRHPAAGATGKSGALVRMHYTNVVESRLALASLEVFRDFDARVGGSCGFEAVGFLQLVPPQYAAALGRNVDRQRRLGIDTRVVGASEVKALLPGCVTDDLGAAAWEPGSGFADPNATTFAYVEAARRLGVAVETGCPVTRILVERGRVAAVETPDGRIATRTVVVAAGAWSNALLAPLGHDFGLAPHRIQVSIFRWPLGFGERHPAVIDAAAKSWWRPEGEASTLIGVELGVGHADPDDYDEGVDPGHVAVCRRALAGRLPAFAASTMRGGWAGMIMMSPDGRPIIDQLPGADGLYAMLGDSGTSFKTAPAVGRCLAEWIVDGAPKTADLEAFRSSRFAEGRPWVDEDHYGRERSTVSR